MKPLPPYLLVVALVAFLARDLYVQSIAIWDDMQKRGILTADDAAKPQNAARELERCDALLRRLS